MTALLRKGTRELKNQFSRTRRVLNQLRQQACASSTEKLSPFLSGEFSRVPGVFRGHPCQACGGEHDLIIRDGEFFAGALYAYDCPTGKWCMGFSATLLCESVEEMPPNAIECRLFERVK